jgi:hypothetical protein
LLLLLSSDRPLSYVAAAAVSGPTDGAGGTERPWHRLRSSRPVPPAPAGPDPGGLTTAERLHLASIVEAGVVGEPAALDRVLTDDAQGWSPTLAYSSRAEAQARLMNDPWPLVVEKFHVTGLAWSPPYVFAEWWLEARQSGPLLVADEFLVEASKGSVELAGASVAQMRGDRISAIHTYFDDAGLIERLVMDRKDRAHPPAASKP